MDNLPTKITFNLDKKYKEKKVEKESQPITRYVRYRSKDLPDYVFVYSIDSQKWSIRKDLLRTPQNSL